MATVVLDLDGTLYLAGRVLPGAVDTVRRLRADGHRLRFVTNTDSRSGASLVARLRSFGIDAAPDELFTPVDAAVMRLRAVDDARVLAVTNVEVRRVLAAVATILPPERATRATHVVVGDCREVLDHALLDAAYRAVAAGAQLLAMQRGRTYRADDGTHLDTGAVVAAIEYASDRSSELLGKPATALLQRALGGATLPLQPSDDVWVVGDDPTTDVRMGNAAGARTVLLTSAGDLPTVVTDDVPDHVLASIADLPSLLADRTR